MIALDKIKKIQLYNDIINNQQNIEIILERLLKKILDITPKLLEVIGINISTVELEKMDSEANIIITKDTNKIFIRNKDIVLNQLEKNYNIAIKNIISDAIYRNYLANDDVLDLIMDNSYDNIMRELNPLTTTCEYKIIEKLDEESRAQILDLYHYYFPIYKDISNLIDHYSRREI